MTWQEKENARFESERERRIKDGAGGNFIKIVPGEVTTVSVDLTAEPMLGDTKFGKKWIVKTVDPAGKQFEMSDYLYELFVKAVRDKKGVVKLNFMRMGTGKKDTQYSVKVVG